MYFAPPVSFCSRNRVKDLCHIKGSICAILKVKENTMMNNEIFEYYKLIIIIIGR